MKRFLAVVVIALVVVFASLQPSPIEQDLKAEQPTEAFHYIAVGDSYSAGTGTTPDKSWPSRLADHLTEEGIPTVLVANPSVAGYTTHDALTQELVQLPEEADLATLMIGVNDWVQGSPPEQFRSNLRLLIDDLEERVPKGRLFVITIPDFSGAPFGPLYSGGRNITQGIETFNTIIQEEAAHVIDIFPISQSLEMTYSDGLHPDADGYELWEEVIFQAVHPVLTSIKE